MAEETKIADISQAAKKQLTKINRAITNIEKAKAKTEKLKREIKEYSKKVSSLEASLQGGVQADTKEKIQQRINYARRALQTREQELQRINNSKIKLPTKEVLLKERSSWKQQLQKAHNIETQQQMLNFKKEYEKKSRFLNISEALMGEYGKESDNAKKDKKNNKEAKAAMEFMKNSLKNTAEIAKNTSNLKKLGFVGLAFYAGKSVAEAVGASNERAREGIQAFTHAGLHYSTGYAEQSVARALGLEENAYINELGGFANWKNLLGTPMGVEEYKKRALFFNSTMQGAIGGAGMDFSLKKLQDMNPVQAYQYIGMGIARAMKTNPLNAGAVLSMAQQMGFGEIATASYKALRAGLDPVQISNSMRNISSTTHLYDKMMAQYEVGKAKFSESFSSIYGRHMSSGLASMSAGVMDWVRTKIFGDTAQQRADAKASLYDFSQIDKDETLNEAEKQKKKLEMANRVINDTGIDTHGYKITYSEFFRIMNSKDPHSSLEAYFNDMHSKDYVGLYRKQQNMFDKWFYPSQIFTEWRYDNKFNEMYNLAKKRPLNAEQRDILLQSFVKSGKVNMLDKRGQELYSKYYNGRLNEDGINELLKLVMGAADLKDSYDNKGKEERISGEFTFTNSSNSDMLYRDDTNFVRVPSGSVGKAQVTTQQSN